MCVCGSSGGVWASPTFVPRRDAANPMAAALVHSERALPRFLRHLRALLVRHGLLLWLLLLLILAVVFVLRERAQLARITTVLHDADGHWVAGAVAIELGIIALTGVTYQVLLRRLGHQMAWLPLAGVHLRRVLVGTVTPVGGPPSLYVLVRSLARGGVPAEDALLAAGLRSATGYGSFLLVLLPAVSVSHPTRPVLMAAIGLSVVFLAVVSGLAWLLRNPRVPHRWEARLPQRVRAFASRTRRHRLAMSDLRRPFGLALAIRLGGAAMLYASLRAVGENPPMTTALIAYVVGLLFLLIAPVFGGIGVVEIATAVALERMGIPPAPALAAALLCRLTELWLPLALGLAVQVADAGRFGANRPSVAPASSQVRASDRRGGTVAPLRQRPPTTRVAEGSS